jgi:hypothetical protein
MNINHKPIYICNYCSKRGHLENFCNKKKAEAINDITISIETISINKKQDEELISPISIINHNEKDDEDDEESINLRKLISDQRNYLYNDSILDLIERNKNYNEEKEKEDKEKQDKEDDKENKDDNDDKEDKEEDKYKNKYKKLPEKKCNFCMDYNKKNKSNLDINHWTKHPVYYLLCDQDNNFILCPLLKKYVCHVCKKNGHTPKYCNLKKLFEQINTNDSDDSNEFKISFTDNSSSEEEDN